MRLHHSSLVILLFAWGAATELPAAETTQVGLAKVDITPDEPLRLSGYGSRSEPSEGIAQSLWARALVVKSADGPAHVLVSVDTIGFPGALTTRIARRLEQQHGITRERFVACGTHSHCAPHLPEGLVNIFLTPLTSEEQAASERYTQQVEDKVVAVVGMALQDLAPGRLLLGEGKVGFAINRRVLADGKWTGFGETPQGRVDHSLPVLKVVASDGTLRGVVFNYACHCTTLGGNFNRVNGDWAGYAQEYLEEMHPGIVALCTIGCGADANPSPRGELEMARAHGRAVALEVKKVLQGETVNIQDAPVASFGYAGLIVERPSIEELKARLNDSNPQRKRHAEQMLALHKKMGRLPETYPMPIQTWQFGESLTMVFLGGEVVVDYAHRLKQEISAKNVWVTAYANDVFAYVPSERVRQEGGYEVDRSMIYYNQPGPWAAGTEEVVIKRVHEVLEHPMSEGALSATEALKTFQLPDEFVIEAVATEPLVQDPINFAFGPDGRLWVVEMGDYPRGGDDRGAPGGRIKFLTDEDGDGIFDSSTLFLDGLSFPTGVMPWRDGILISAAPDILFASDQDGDGRADETRILFTGFAEANPQHRLNGFTYGLDHWLYVASGDDAREITSLQTGEAVNVSGRDLRIRPDEGRAEPISGHTQYGLHRDDWGNWFGGNNSRPIFHYAISDRYLSRNRDVPSPRPIVDLLEPAFAPPVFPISRTVDRFNDLFAANRFTSACSPHIFRDSSLGPDVAGSAFICEPVHNLVNRTRLIEDGITYRGDRHLADEHSEFLASTDVWFRPTRVRTGPDGALWIADMYRQVIEHPEWIPLDWQQRLNLRAGEERGRIYRVYRKGERPTTWPRLSEMASGELVGALADSNGVVRDLAQQLLIERQDRDVAAALVNLASNAPAPITRVHALWTLDGLDILTPEQRLIALQDADWRVQQQGILLAETWLNSHAELGLELLKLVEHPQLRVRYQLALSLGEWDDPRAAVGLTKLLLQDLNDSWMRTAILSSATNHSARMLPEVMRHAGESTAASEIVQQLIATTLGRDRSHAVIRNTLEHIVQEQEAESWQFAALGSAFDALERKEIHFEHLKKSENEDLRGVVTRIAALMSRARALVADSEGALPLRIAAMRVLARDPSEAATDRQLLAALLAPTQPLPIQHAAVQTLMRTRSADVPALLLRAWKRSTPSMQQTLLEALLSRPAWTEHLLEALEAGHVSVDDLGASARNRLVNSRERTLRDRARGLFETTSKGNREAIVQQFQHVLDLPGNLLRGSRIFAKRCATCHQFRGLGREVGPKLESLQDRSGQALLTSILDPNRAVERKYRSCVAVTQDGRVHDGMVVEESTSSITLARPNGEQTVLLRADLEEFTNTGRSFMPEGLERDLSERDLADVITFVQSSAPSSSRTPQPKDLAASRSQLAEAGINATGISVTGRKSQQVSHWLGTGKVATCRLEPGAETLRWTYTVSRTERAGSEPALFRIPVAFHTPTQSNTNFELLLPGAAHVQFPAAQSDFFRNGSDGRVTMRYLAMAADAEGSSGLLDIEIDRSLLPDDGTVEFRVRALAGAADAWFGIILPQ